MADQKRMIKNIDKIPPDTYTQFKGESPFQPAEKKQ